MALNQNVVWEIRTTGNDSNGGGFQTGATGTDRSQQAAAHATLTAASVVHTVLNQINVAVGDFTVSAADVGNLLQVTGGTATAGFYQIIGADVPNNRWTMDRNVGTAGQTVVGAMGGALASLGKVGTNAVLGNKIYIAAGTYSITSATNNISNGTFNNTNGVYIEGYQTARGDLGTKPLLQASAIATFTLIAMVTNSPNACVNVKLDGASAVSSRGINFRGMCYRVEVVNCTNSAFTSDIAVGTCVMCSATGCSGAVTFLNVNAIASISHDNTIGAFTGNYNFFTDCIADSNSVGASDGFTLGGTGDSYVTNCIAYNNGRDGFRVTTSRGIQLINCIAEGNAAWGVNCNAQSNVMATNCAYFNNTSGDFTPSSGVFNQNLGAVTCTASPFTNAAGQNFGLNNTAGAGAACRAAGLPASFLVGSSIAYQDIGAVQHQDTGGGGASPFSAAYVG